LVPEAKRDSFAVASRLELVRERQFTAEVERAVIPT
jgi:hypothetical protein